LIIYHEDLDTIAAPQAFPFVSASVAASQARYSSKMGEARLMIGNCIRIMCRAPKSRAGCRFAAAIGLRSSPEDFAPTIPDWANDQHTLTGASLGAVSTISARKVPSWSRRQQGPTPTRTKPIGCGRSSGGASKGGT
jgi:replication-associated recombination protein RarA